MRTGYPGYSTKDWGRARLVANYTFCSIQETSNGATAQQSTAAKVPVGISTSCFYRGDQVLAPAPAASDVLAELALPPLALPLFILQVMDDGHRRIESAGRRARARDEDGDRHRRGGEKEMLALQWEHM